MCKKIQKNFKLIVFSMFNSPLNFFITVTSEKTCTSIYRMCYNGTVDAHLYKAIPSHYYFKPKKTNKNYQSKFLKPSKLLAQASTAHTQSAEWPSHRHPPEDA